MSNKYIQEFFNLDCAGDIINVVGRLGKNFEKEITEAMAVISRIRPIVMKDPLKHWDVIDLCAGNALVSVISVFLWDNVWGSAVDTKPRERNWFGARRFEYLNIDIRKVGGFQGSWGNKNKELPVDSIIVGVHTCGSLSAEVVRLYKQSPSAKHLILMPCCTTKGYDPTKRYYKVITDIVDPYLLWATEIAESVGGECKQDEHVLSPKNAIITASKLEVPK